jgi:hypothetical protein
MLSTGTPFADSTDTNVWPHLPRRPTRTAAPLRPVTVAGPVPAPRDGPVVLAIGPEAQHDERGFDRSVRLAEDRLKEIEA